MQIANPPSSLSFVELLFAVLILGIGLIMVAAIFPAGLSQTKGNMDETQAASIARGALGAIQSVATKADFPENNDVVAMQKVVSVPASALPNIAARTMINVADSRYAWVGMYFRPAPIPPVTTSEYAQVMYFVVNRSDPYNVGTDIQKSSVSVQFLTPRPILTTLDPIGLTVGVDTTVAADASNPSAVGSGCFLVIRGYSPTPAAVAASGDMAVSVKNNNTGVVTTPAVVQADIDHARQHVTGLCFRVGELNGAAYDYFPGAEFKPITFSWIDTTVSPTTTHTVTVNKLTDARGFILGRNRVGTAGTPDDFDGPIQDVAYYTSFVSLK